MGTFGIDFSDRKVLEEGPSDNGAFTLSWEKAPEAKVVVEQAPSADFSEALVIYSGTDRATVVTGLREGRHYFRIRLENAPAWSEPLVLRVEFVSKATLRLLLAIGAVVVLATVGVIIFGFLKDRREGGAP
jgi:hypothetical protein